MTVDKKRWHHDVDCFKEITVRIGFNGCSERWELRYGAAPFGKQVGDRGPSLRPRIDECGDDHTAGGMCGGNVVPGDVSAANEGDAKQAPRRGRRR